HNLLGKLNYEVMSMSRIKRAMGRIFMGNDALSAASWELAEHHLERAAEMWPELVLFQYVLAELHRKRGSEEEAREAYERVLELPAVHPPDERLQQRAQDYLAGKDDGSAAGPLTGRGAREAGARGLAPPAAEARCARCSPPARCWPAPPAAPPHPRAPPPGGRRSRATRPSSSSEPRSASVPACRARKGTPGSSRGWSPASTH